ncbi:pilus assembly protein CpaB [Klenkia soli]|uniref:Pilus assembly protein CpaB n=1 Tax=Klenkia soli TaxID=1052260 RepID=A0A1H0T0R2_9ACTN|nr:RcpC/CpaB family pilus assembly protein [Klenkia soli]SDP47534.1 pilus assembly protein CpaB [Klenkia soli]
MNRRLVAAVVAVLVAAAGAWVILGYVRGADARAQSAEQLTPVLVVASEVPAGTPVADLGTAVSLQQVPARLVTSGTLSDLASVTGLVTTTDLLPGDMVQSGRFGDPTAARADGSVPAPAGTEEISVTLDRQRSVGGALAPGDLVGVFGTADTINDGPEVSFQLDGVLVTRVASPSDPDGIYTITLALSPEASTVVQAAQSKGTVYLSLQAAGTAAASRYSSDISGLAGGDSSSDSSSTTTSSSGGNS